MALALYLSVALLMQETVPALPGGSTTPAETTATGGTTVHLAPEQMAQLAAQGQGNTAFITGFLALALFCLAGMFWRSTESEGR